MRLRDDKGRFISLEKFLKKDAENYTRISPDNLNSKQLKVWTKAVPSESLPLYSQAAQSKQVKKYISKVSAGRKSAEKRPVRNKGKFIDKDFEKKLATMAKNQGKTLKDFYRENKSVIDNFIENGNLTIGYNIDKLIDKTANFKGRWLVDGKPLKGSEVAKILMELQQKQRSKSNVAYIQVFTKINVATNTIEFNTIINEDDYESAKEEFGIFIQKS